MKKLLLVGLVFVSGVSYGAGTGPYRYDDTGAVINTELNINGGTKLLSRTIAQLNAITPRDTDIMVGCSDCVVSAVCVSSGTGTGAFVILTASGPFVGACVSGFAHCQ